MQHDSGVSASESNFIDPGSVWSRVCVCVLKIGLLSAWGENKHSFLSAANKVHLSLKE